MSDAMKGRAGWAVGGCTLVGLGVGFIYLTTNVFWFLAALLIGIGAGLVLGAILSPKNQGL